MQDRHFKHWPKGLSKQLTLPETSLYYNLEVSAARYPDQPAVLFYDTPLSYAQLQSQARALAGKYDLDLIVTESDMSLPLAYRNSRFRIYNLNK